MPTKKTAPAKRAAAPAKKAPVKKAAKKAPAKKTAAKKTARKTASKTARPEAQARTAPKSTPYTQPAWPDPTEAIFERFGEFADRAAEQAGVIGKQVSDTMAELAKQAEGEIEKGREYLRGHQTEAVLGALAAAAVAALAAGRATYKSVRRR